VKVSDEQFQKIQDLIESGKKEGAKLMCGGGRSGDKGYFIYPTVFADVEDHMRIAREEVQNLYLPLLIYQNCSKEKDTF